MLNQINLFVLRTLSILLAVTAPVRYVLVYIFFRIPVLFISGRRDWLRQLLTMNTITMEWNFGVYAYMLLFSWAFSLPSNVLVSKNPFKMAYTILGIADAAYTAFLQDMPPEVYKMSSVEQFNWAKSEASERAHFREQAIIREAMEKLIR